MIDASTLPAKADCLEACGLRDAARHLRRMARRLGVPPRPVERPALAGLSARDLDGLGIPWRRDGDGRLLVVSRPRG